MKPPRLTQALVLEAPEQVSDGAGGFVRGWVVVGSLWAEMTARTGREVASAGATVSRTAYRIVVRGAPFGTPERPQPEQRFRQGSRVFSIQAVAEQDPEGRYLTCFANEEVAV